MNIFVPQIATIHAACYYASMRSSMNISLPASLRQWVEGQVEARGFGTASEFVRDVIRREREKTLLARVDQTLLRAIRTPVTELTNDDWNDIRTKGRKLARKRRKA
jgi:antitoxin ParD1/3/4